MKRDMFKVVETMEEVPSAYDITCGEIALPAEECRNGKMFNTICTAFKYGFALA